MSASSLPVRRILIAIPLAVLALLVVVWGVGLTRDPSAIPTVLINTPAPVVELGPVDGAQRGISAADGEGQVHLVNFFASWCVPCAYEHQTLLQIQGEGGPPIYGVAWKDGAGVGPWLVRHGDPYAAVGNDQDGRTAINFGITGAPETFVIDRRGRIRYKQVGVITPQVWKETLEPLIEKLETEPKPG
jgi:cytochrome c biogenesis protein CcmG/thiol:disulfide interchange protein DsbE